MLDVRWDFRNKILKERAEKGAVGKVIRYYGRGLAGVECPNHGQGPWLRVQGRTLEALSVRIEACCPHGLERVEARLDAVSRRGPE